jgi:hypothetical protein
MAKTILQFKVTDPADDDPPRVGAAPGLPPRWAQTHLELFASKVFPAFR